MSEPIVCHTCQDWGWIVATAHDPHCNGWCGSSCPIQIQENCPDCHSTDTLDTMSNEATF